MSKKEIHQQELVPLFDSLFDGSGSDALLDYLVAQSNLPGRRANLELAQAFADSIASWAPGKSKELWALCAQMTGVSAEEAPVNDPREFQPFCGAVGIGALGATRPEFREPALQTLHSLANDPRWRMREAVCFGLQRLLAADARQTVTTL